MIFAVEKRGGSSRRRDRDRPMSTSEKTNTGTSILRGHTTGKGILAAALLLILASISLVNACGGASSDQERAGETGTGEASTAASLPKLIDLGAGTCIPCKKMAPILEALRDDFKGQFDVVFIDVWKDRNQAAAYKIRLIPTQIYFDPAGRELRRHEGYASREDILGTWKTLGYTFEKR
jgi:thioredoxin 1